MQTFLTGDQLHHHGYYLHDISGNHLKERSSRTRIWKMLQQLQRLCPYCKSEISAEAVRCPHCTSSLDTNKDKQHPLKAITHTKTGSSMIPVFLESSFTWKCKHSTSFRCIWWDLAPSWRKTFAQQISFPLHQIPGSHDCLLLKHAADCIAGDINTCLSLHHKLTFTLVRNSVCTGPGQRTLTKHGCFLFWSSLCIASVRRSTYAFVA